MHPGCGAGRTGFGSDRVDVLGAVYLEASIDSSQFAILWLLWELLMCEVSLSVMPGGHAEKFFEFSREMAVVVKSHIVGYFADGGF